MENQSSNEEYWTKQRILGIIISVILTISLIAMTGYNRGIENWFSVVKSILEPILIGFAIFPIIQNSFDNFRNLEHNFILICLVSFLATLLLYYILNMLNGSTTSMGKVMIMIFHCLMLGFLCALSYWLTVLDMKFLNFSLAPTRLPNQSNNTNAGILDETTNLSAEDNPKS